jgi:hypothetical protein
MRAAASARSSSEIRRRSVASKVSDTASRHAVATPRRPPSVNRVAASISTATAPLLSQASARGRGGPSSPSLGHRKIGRHDPDGRRVPSTTGQPSGEVGIRLGDFSGAQGAARSVLCQRVTGDEELAMYELGIERSASAHSDRPPHAELGQLVEDDRGARASHPGGLDAQPPAARRLPRVSPEPAGVVAHPRLGEELLGEREGAAGVTGEQGVLRVLGAGTEVVRHGPGTVQRRARPGCRG